jgi:UDP-N-acetyl-D-mannosaminuronic acid transferase (WecB/TagA/CpsF family)
MIIRRTLDSVRVLGVRVDCVDMESTLNGIAEMISRRQGGLVATVNPES